MRTRIGRGSVAEGRRACVASAAMERGGGERNGGRAGLVALAVILALAGPGPARRRGRGPAARRSPTPPPTPRIAANLDRGEGFDARLRGEREVQPVEQLLPPACRCSSPALYKLTGGVHDRPRPDRARPARRRWRFPSPTCSGAGSAAGRPGLIGAAAIAIYPALLEYQGMLLTEPLAATLLSGAVAGRLLLRRADATSAMAHGCARRAVRSRWRWCARSTWAIAVLAAARRWLAQRRQIATGGSNAAVVPLLVSLLGTAVILAPWTMRNAVALDRFVPVSTGGGKALCIGTYLHADGDARKAAGTAARAASPASRFEGGAVDEPTAASSSGSWPRSRPSAIRDWKPTRRSGGWAARTSGTTSARSRSRFAGMLVTRRTDLDRHGRAT